MMRSQWMSGIGGMLMASAALLWFIDPAGAIPLESWDDKIPNAGTRFKVLTEFNSQAVLDKETQLVWERSPGNTNLWELANRDCINKNVGGRKGWRLPSIPELASLIDPSVAPPGPTLPAGHPFTNVLSSFGFWSATQVLLIPQGAWVVDFSNGDVNVGSKPEALWRVWCVRGGHNHESAY